MSYCEKTYNTSIKYSFYMDNVVSSGGSVWSSGVRWPLLERSHPPRAPRPLLRPVQPRSKLRMGDRGKILCGGREQGWALRRTVEWNISVCRYFFLFLENNANLLILVKLISLS